MHNKCPFFVCDKHYGCVYYTPSCIPETAKGRLLPCHYHRDCCVCEKFYTCSIRKEKERKEVKSMKLIGFVAMQKKHGKILFVTEKGSGKIAGDTCDKIFLFEDVADKVNETHIGKNISVSYGCGYSGKAYVADITIN